MKIFINSIKGIKLLSDKKYYYTDLKVEQIVINCDDNNEIKSKLIDLDVFDPTNPESIPTVNCYSPYIGLEEDSDMYELMEGVDDTKKEKIGEECTIWSIIYTYIQLFHTDRISGFRDLTTDDRIYKTADKGELDSILNDIPYIFTSST